MEAIYSCVTDGSPKYDQQVWVWVRTLLTLGRRSPEELIVHAAGSGTPLLKRVEELGVRVVPVPAFEDQRYPHSNRLAQLESEALSEADYVILCDCDLAFAADISPWVAGDRIRAKIVDMSRPPLKLWRNIFRAAGFPGEPRPARPSNERTPTYVNNLNGGLYIMPQEAFRKLREPWPRWDRWAIENVHLLGKYGKHVFQVSFGLVMEELGFEVDLLPVSLNFPTHLPFPKRAIGDVEPLVVHYHDRVGEDGLLLKVGLERVDTAVARVNEVLATWDQRDG